MLLSSASRVLPGAALPTTLVARPRLTDLLDAGVAGPLTTVVAPAGWGKTTVLRSWMHEAGHPVAWLSVERRDDADHFWPKLGNSLSAAGFSGSAAWDATGDRRAGLAALAEAVSSYDEPLVVAIDDFHHLADPAVSDELDLLLTRAAPHLRLVIAARSQPMLAVHRWRLSGGLAEVGLDDLAFTADEAEKLLIAHGVELPRDEVELVHRRTEGWAAGLRFAALAMVTESHPAGLGDQLTGDQPTVTEYLTREVLTELSPERRRVLLAGAVSQRLHGGLLDALTGTRGGDCTLTKLHRDNLFIVPIAGANGWYRYHGQLADVLHAQLRRQDPAPISELHRRAAAWYAAHGLGGAALQHALAAGDHARATDVLYKQWHTIATCSPGGVAVESHPSHEAPAAPELFGVGSELALVYLADRLTAADAAGVDRYRRLAGASRERVHPARRDLYRLILAAFDVVSAWRDANPATMIERSHDLLANLPTRRAAVAETVHCQRARAIALLALGAAELNSGRPREAGQALLAAMHVGEDARLPCLRMNCGARLAASAALCGELRRAERVARQVLRSSPCPGWCARRWAAYAYLALAIVCYERDRLDEATRYLHLVDESSQGEVDRFVLGETGLLRAAMLGDHSEFRAAHEVLGRVRSDLVAAGGPATTGHIRTRLARSEVDLRIGQGDTDAARALLDSLRTPDDESPAPDEWPGDLAISGARLHLREGDARGAERLLSQWADRAATPTLSARLAAGLLTAVSAHRLGQARRAAQTIEQVLAIAEAEGFRRPFTYGGVEVRKLLHAQLDTGTGQWGRISDLLGHSGVADADRARAQALVEPLTNREATILRYLQGTLSNVEIAAQLSVSVNTVKTHIRSIYRKLAVIRRRQAVRKARDMDLL